MPSDRPMPRKRSIKLGCPTCKKPVRSADPDFPFCSERCRLIDLGKWASGDYVIPAPLTDTDEDVEESDSPAMLKHPSKPN